MQKKLSKVLKTVKKAAPKKHYLEFVTAALSIPVLLTVILLNLNSLNTNKDAKKDTTPTPQTVIIKEQVPAGNSNNSETTPTPTSATCKKEVGPVNIAYPKEGAVITDNPVNFIIRYTDNGYCSVVWSYRINGGSWSEYSSNSPSVYNLPNGAVKFELRIQSTVSNDQDQVERTFMYQGTSSTPTITPTVTPSS